MGLFEGDLVGLVYARDEMRRQDDVSKSRHRSRSAMSQRNAQHPPWCGATRAGQLRLTVGLTEGDAVGVVCVKRTGKGGGGHRE